MRISSLHDDLLWPCITHVCGLGEVDAVSGKRQPLSVCSPLGRASQFGVTEPLAVPGCDEPLGEAAYAVYQTAIRNVLPRYETIVAAIYDRYFVLDPTADPSEREARAWEDIERCHALADAPGIHLARYAADFAPPDETTLVLAIEGMDWVRRGSQAERLWDAGVRVFALQYNHPNALCAGDCATDDGGEGLTPLGKQVVSWLLERGAIIDLAHTARAARTDILDLVEVTERWGKVAYTHGGILEHTDVPFAQRMPGRFLHEDEAWRIHDVNGMVGFTPARLFYPSLEAFAQSVDTLLVASPGNTAAIAIGTDFGGLGEHLLFPELRSVTQMETIAAVLRENHGWDNADDFLRGHATRWLRDALQ